MLQCVQALGGVMVAPFLQVGPIALHQAELLSAAHVVVRLAPKVGEQEWWCLGSCKATRAKAQAAGVGQR